jgi:prepilin signal peptidase PulO-like enzyme (type II secretory pathway)
MIFVNLFIFFILGTIIGSFINVVVLRYHTGRSFVTGRSLCFTCSKTLSWYELVPIFSFLFLRGRCLNCNGKISYQYPIVEFITGLVFFGITWKLGLSTILSLYLLMASVLIAISVYDIKHKIIPNGMVFVFDLLALVTLFVNHGVYASFSMPGLLDLLAGPILFIFFALLWAVSLGKWMGLGDAKLALGVGWVLGLSGGIFAIIMAFWIGAVWSLAILSLQKLKISRFGLTIKSEVPFAPFIIIAFFLQFFTGWNFATLMNVLN